MGKKKARKFFVPGTQDGPNKQFKPPKPQQQPESDSDDSFVLDNPVEQVGRPFSSSESDSDTGDKTTMRVQIKQVYKNPAAGAHFYGAVQADSDVVSSEAVASDIDYQIKLVPFEKKKKQKDDENPLIESMFQPRNRAPPPRFNRAPPSRSTRSAYNDIPIQPQLLRAPPPSFTNQQIKSEVKVEAAQETNEPEWDMQSVTESLPQSIAASSKKDWDTESIVSSVAWDNMQINFG